MARSRTHIPLGVFLNGRHVGRLRKKKSGAIDFQYDESWLSWEHTFPVSLSLPLREDRYIGDPVVAVFDNLLPDNINIRRRLAERIQAAGDDAYSLLAAIGRDCVGALQFLPADTKPETSGEIQGESVSDARIAAILADLGRTPLGVSVDEEAFRISIAGAQDKTALLFWKKAWYLPHGSTPTTHIFKPQIGVLKNGIDLSRSVENEHLCMELARALGLATAKTAMAEFSGKRVLIVERFDRQWTSDGRLLRLPQEDCCQALSTPPVRKYQADGGPGIHQILEFLKASDNPEEDQRIFIRAQILFWLLGATDGHAKNFSVFLHPGGGFRLTPLYDVMSAQPNLDANQMRRKQMKLAMSVGDSRHYIIDTIMPRHFVQSAEKAGVPASIVHEQMRQLRDRVPDAIATITKDTKGVFPEAIKTSIVRGIEKRLKLIDLSTIP
ncbi:MAG TPA: type II toxin-antitoxin system HipA family toxin [Steroidobacteraceae bacterium]